MSAVETQVLRGLTLAVALAVTGCADQGPEIPVFEGQWYGSSNLQGSDVDVEITSNENSEGEISGTGVFHPAGGFLAFTIDGEHDYPYVSFTIAAPGHADANFAGQWDGNDRVDGHLVGSGFTGEALTLFRQD